MDDESDNGDRRGWQYLFFVLGGFAVFPLVLGFFVVPRDTRPLKGAGIDRRVDWIGGGLGTLAFSLLLFSLAQSGIAARGWNEPCQFGYSLLSLASY
jgi:predicted MFS family arabinose efflux permease